MAADTSLTIALVMGLFLLAVVTVITRNKRWRIYEASDEGESTPESDALIEGVIERARNPGTWTLLFVFMTAGFAVSVLLYVGGDEASRRTAGFALAGFLLILVSSFLFIGTYITAKSKGRSNAWGVAEGIFALGVAFIGAIVVNLLIG